MREKAEERQREVKRNDRVRYTKARKSGETRRKTENDGESTMVEGRSPHGPWIGGL